MILETTYQWQAFKIYEELKNRNLKVSDVFYVRENSCYAIKLPKSIEDAGVLLREVAKKLKINLNDLLLDKMSI